MPILCDLPDLRGFLGQASDVRESSVVFDEGFFPMLPICVFLGGCRAVFSSWQVFVCVCVSVSVRKSPVFGSESIAVIL